jgi:hypothetical protein
LRSFVATSLAVCLIVSCAAPIVPQRGKPGGSARWAENIALKRALGWAKNPQLCRIAGAGVGTDGWLPDRGGTWELDYWSESKPSVLEVTIDSDGAVQTREVANSPERGRVLPATWLDSPKVWSATRRHSKQEPVHTFDAELAFDAEPQRYPDRPVWRIRFWQQDNSYEIHVVSTDGEWLTSY